MATRQKRIPTTTKLLHVLVAITATQMASCTVGELPEITEIGCDTLWTIEMPEVVKSSEKIEATVELGDGALTLQSAVPDVWVGEPLDLVCETRPCAPIKVYQSELTGDFEATFTFEDFIPDGPGSNFYAFVVEEPSLNFPYHAMAGIDFVTENEVNVSMADVSILSANGSPYKKEAWDTSSGTLSIARAGSQLTVTAGTQSVSNQFSDGAISIGMLLDSVTDDDGGASVTFTDVTFTGGAVGTAMSDAFDCDETPGQ